MADLRNTERQHDRLRFRRNLERVGELLAYELSKTFTYTPQTIHTPLDAIEVATFTPPVVLSILRAGLPLHQGILNYFDRSDSGFVGAFRQPTTNHDFTITADYQAFPSVKDRVVVLADPMLATGRTMAKAAAFVMQQGTPAHLHVVAVVGCPEGVRHLQDHCPIPYSLWLGALDSHLNDKSYIVPGLGDAGDLAFGPKL